MVPPSSETPLPAATSLERKAIRVSPEVLDAYVGTYETQPGNTIVITKTGEQLFGLLRQIGLDVRLDTKIQVLEHGELKSLADKFR